MDFQLSTGEQHFFSIPMQYGMEMDNGRFLVDWDGSEMVTTDVRRFQIGLVGGEFIQTEWGDWYRQEPILTEEVPEIFIRRFWESWERSGFYDRDGNQITGEPWMLGNMYATDFALYDFDGNGIPTIKIYYWGNLEGSGDGGPPTSLFRYTDGTFQRVYAIPPTWAEGAPTTWWFPWQGYYHDEVGRLVGYFYGINEPMPVYMYITFDGAWADKEIIVRGFVDWENFDWEVDIELPMVWHNYMTGESISNADPHIPWIPWSGVVLPRTIAGTETQITRILPMDAWQESLTASIVQRLEEAR
jgi:hypothetical protein